MSSFSISILLGDLHNTKNKNPIIIDINKDILKFSPHKYKVIVNIITNIK